MTSGIYAIVNTVNDNRCIGSAVNISRRWGDHCRCLQRGTHENRHLQNAWNKYGEDAFRFEVLEECDPEMLLGTEQRILDAFLPEYNICKVAGSALGCRRTEATRRKMSENARPWNVGKKMLSQTSAALLAANTGKKHTVVARAKMSVAQRGHVVTPEARAKMSVAHIGKKRSPESLAKQSVALKGKKRTPFSAEWKANLAAAGKGNRNHLGHRHTSEARAKMSVAATRRYAKKETVA